MENLYYDAEDYRASNPVKALGLFRSLINSAKTPSSWYDFQYLIFVQRRTFKASIQIVCISCRLMDTSHLIEDIERIFSSAEFPSRNEIIDGIMSVLDSV